MENSIDCVNFSKNVFKYSKWKSGEFAALIAIFYIKCLGKIKHFAVIFFFFNQNTLTF